ncbi:hypothetical protein J2S74_000885 [Evansella vedderi]|uniref:Atrophied bacterial Ig domain-containing protein n=1 Tax=Evansella vedderi TaxID=38282 RepID=A0ABT9ZQJ8_9BACI|nr:immunoglobulin-like domain-containing protein [Evansella vedderi]MDQ0253513.1 hypothetical protein [Evansella vedderi]
MIKPLSAEKIVEITKANLQIPNADDIRGNITLPSRSEAGATITWETNNPDVVSVTEIINDRDEWILMVDQYIAGLGYLPLRTTDLLSAEFTILHSSEYSLGNFKKRHGSVINVTQEEYEAIMKKWSGEEVLELGK